jgi:hypothetical protein
VASGQSIDQFPNDVDRHLFGAYVSGLIDGEGCFRLSFTRRQRSARETPHVVFQINLRADDLPILRLLQSFFGCGNIHFRAPIGKTLPQFCFKVTRNTDLVHVVIPHFSRYPLFAKKRFDFTIWSEGVHLVHLVMSRRRRWGGNCPGFAAQWTPAELAHFRVLVEGLKKQREYDAPIQPMPPPPRSAPPEPLLFD